MKIFRKWSPKTDKFTSHPRKHKKPDVLKNEKQSNYNLDSEISLDLMPLSNQSFGVIEPDQVTNISNYPPSNYDDGSCICLFIMLVLYYLSILNTKLKNSLLRNINNLKTDLKKY